jgi:hypothetical protein
LFPGKSHQHDKYNDEAYYQKQLYDPSEQERRFECVDEHLDIQYKDGGCVEDEGDPE